MRVATPFGPVLHNLYGSTEVAWATIATPQDLVHGQEGTGVHDPKTATRAVNVYRSAPPTGKGGLDAVSTTGGN